MNRRRASRLALAAGVWLAACGGDEPAPGDAYGPKRGGVDHEARRDQLRDELKRMLGASYDEPLPPVDAEQLALGEDRWARWCASCHGATGRAATSLGRMLPIQPRDLSDPDEADFFSPRAKVWIVSEGSPGTPMTAWRGVLSPEEIRAVTAFMETLVVREGEAE